jgi:hypothetical protein
MTAEEFAAVKAVTPERDLPDWMYLAAEDIYNEAEEAEMSCLEPTHFAINRIAHTIERYYLNAQQ